MTDDFTVSSDATIPAWRRIDPAMRERVHDLGPVLLVADHLDAALALGEDLSHLAATLSGTQSADGDEALARNASLARFAQDVRAVELGLAQRVLQARKRALSLDVAHEHVRLLVRSFIGGTAILAHAVETERDGLGSTARGGLVPGPEALRFLKARGVVAADVLSLDDLGVLAVTEDFTVAGLIRLGDLMDMIAAFLDALDTAFDLYAPQLALLPGTDSATD